MTSADAEIADLGKRIVRHDNELANLATLITAINDTDSANPIGGPLQRTKALRKARLDAYTVDPSSGLSPYNAAVKAKTDADLAIVTKATYDTAFAADNATTVVEGTLAKNEREAQATWTAKQ